MFRRGFILLVFSMLAHEIIAGSADENSIKLSNSQNSYSIGKSLLVLKDLSQTLSFADVLKSRRDFKKSEIETPNFGAGSTVVWCSFSVENSSRGEWYLEVDTPYLNEVDLYSIDEKGKTEHQQVGLDKPFSARPVKVSSFILPLNLKKGEKKTFYLRVKSASTLKLALQIATLTTFYENNQKKDLVHSIYFGLILALSIYNLFVFFTLRDRTYLFYVLYITFTAVVVAWLRGFSHEFLFQNSPFINEGNYFAAITFIFFALFSINFLRLEKYAPKLKHLAWFYFVIAAYVIVFTIFRQRVLGFYGIVAMVDSIIPFVLIIGITAYRRGFTPARYYLIGFFLFTVGDVIFVLKDLAIVPQALITEYSFEMGSALEAIVLSFALADKLNTFKKEKEMSQTKAIHQANEFSRQLIRSQEIERQLISGELQESIGQSLSALKNQTSLLQKESPTPDAIEDINEVIAYAIQEVRNISYGLRPFQLDLLGLTHALKSLVADVADSSGIVIDTQIDMIDGLFEKDAEINVYRIVQECLNNMIKHAEAKKASVKLLRRENAVSIFIQDDGIGIDSEKDVKGLGLIGIKERVQILKGELNIVSGLQKGTLIEVKLILEMRDTHFVKEERPDPLQLVKDLP